MVNWGGGKSGGGSGGGTPTSGGTPTGTAPGGTGKLGTGQGFVSGGSSAPSGSGGSVPGGHGAGNVGIVYGQPGAGVQATYSKPSGSGGIITAPAPSGGGGGVQAPSSIFGVTSKAQYEAYKQVQTERQAIAYANASMGYATSRFPTKGKKETARELLQQKTRDLFRVSTIPKRGEFDTSTYDPLAGSVRYKSSLFSTGVQAKLRGQQIAIGRELRVPRAPPSLPTIKSQEIMSREKPYILAWRSLMGWGKLSPAQQQSIIAEQEEREIQKIVSRPEATTWKQYEWTTLGMKKVKEPTGFGVVTSKLMGAGRNIYETSPWAREWVAKPFLGVAEGVVGLGGSVGRGVMQIGTWAKSETTPTSKSPLQAGFWEVGTERGRTERQGVTPLDWLYKKIGVHPGEILKPYASFKGNIFAQPDVQNVGLAIALPYGGKLASLGFSAYYGKQIIPEFSWEGYGSKDWRQGPGATAGKLGAVMIPTILEFAPKIARSLESGGLKFSERQKLLSAYKKAETTLTKKYGAESPEVKSFKAEFNRAFKELPRRIVIDKSWTSADVKAIKGKNPEVIKAVDKVIKKYKSYIIGSTLIKAQTGLKETTRGSAGDVDIQQTLQPGLERQMAYEIRDTLQKYGIESSVNKGTFQGSPKYHVTLEGKEFVNIGTSKAYFQETQIPAVLKWWEPRSFTWLKEKSGLRESSITDQMRKKFEMGYLKGGGPKALIQRMELIKLHGKISPEAYAKLEAKTPGRAKDILDVKDIMKGTNKMFKGGKFTGKTISLKETLKARLEEAPAYQRLSSMFESKAGYVPFGLGLPMMVYERAPRIVTKVEPGKASLYVIPVSKAGAYSLPKISPYGTSPLISKTAYSVYAPPSPTRYETPYPVTPSAYSMSVYPESPAKYPASYPGGAPSVYPAPYPAPRPYPGTYPRTYPAPKPTTYPRPYGMIPPWTPKTPKKRIKLQFGAEEKWGKGFDVFARRRGQWFKITPKAVEKGKAFNIGAKYTKWTAGASFKVLPSTKPVRISKTKPYYWGRVRGQYYSNPSKSGETIYIQKNVFRIMTSGEKKQITYKGILASQRARARSSPIQRWMK